MHKHAVKKLPFVKNMFLIDIRLNKCVMQLFKTMAER